MFQIVLNKFFMLFPPDSYLSWLIFITFVLILLYLYLLPKRIHDEAIVKLENKLAIELTEIKSNLDKETELLKIIRSQVEPQKVDIYTKVADHFSTKFSELFIKDGKPVSSNIKFDKSYVDAMSRLFFFASDKTIRRYIELKENTRTDLLIVNDLLANLIVSMRQDLQSETGMTADDFLTLIGMKLSKKD